MLKIHFLNVGKGNCTIIDFPSERLSMIDIDNSKARDEEELLTEAVAYVQSNFRNRALFRFVLTHPDMDHMSGLDELAQRVSILNFWDTDHNKTFDEDEWEDSPYNQEDWERYQQFRQSSEDPNCLRLYRNQTSECCWIQDGITILSPSRRLVELANRTEEYHHLSYVLMIEYAGVKVLLGGDASVEAWDEIYNNYQKQFLKSNIFLVPHHGSKNNIHKTAFATIAPDYVIVSVASGVDYDYEYYSRIASKEVLSTKYYGTIQLQIKDNGEYLPILVERNA